MNRIQIEEKTLEFALVKAAHQLGVTQSDVSYQIVKQHTGFLGLFGRHIVIEAWRKEGRPAKAPRERRLEKNPRSKSSRPSQGSSGPKGEPSKPLVKYDYSEEELQKLQNDLTIFCQGICARLLGEELELSPEREGERLVFNIKHPELQEMASKNHKLIEALEHLLRKKPRPGQGEFPFKIYIDVGGTRQSREEELINMALDLSNKVAESRRPIVLNYRSSYDRKVIHMALDKDQRVYTKSIGSGMNRKLMILPSREHRERSSSEVTES